MKLGIKIFFGVMIPFSVIVLIGGYILLSFFYKNTINREIQAAWERYQYNKFVVQSEMLTQEGKFSIEDEIETFSDITEGLTETSALFSADYSLLYNGFHKQIDFVSILEKVEVSKVNYEFQTISNRMYLLMCGVVEQKDNRVYLVTGMDVEYILELQQQMKNKVFLVYLFAICVGICLSAALSVLFTKPIKALIIATEQIANGQYGEQIVVRRRDEVGQLALNFNRMALAVQEKIEELSDAARQKEDFVANFAHELKTPLTSMIGYADRIYQKNMPREEQKQAAWYIWNEGMRLEALSKKLMDLTLLNHHEFLLEEVSTNILFQELVGDVLYHAKQKNVLIKSEIEEACVKIEYDLLKSLFYNLLDNALKANAKHITIKGNKNRESTFYCIEISDDGRGIPLEDIKRITEAFYMVDKSRSRKLHGAGLGLALSKRIAEIHGSTLVFQSDGVHGTKVSFSLQCKEEKSDEQG